MAIALKSVLRSQQLPLILRAAAFGGALVLLRIFPGNAAVVFLFVLVAFISYLTPLFNSGKFFGTFVIFSALVYRGVGLVPGPATSIAIPLFAMFFYLLLATKDLSLVHRAWWQYLLHIAVFYGIFLIFFKNGELTVLSSLLIWFIILVLFKEFLKGPLTLSAVLGFLTLQAVLAISFLPFGFVGAASVALVLIFFLTDISRAMIQNNISPRLILTDLTIVTLMVLFISATTSWSV